MSELKINTEELINAYLKGESLNAIARAFNTYPTTVRRILEKNKIELRHDAAKKGKPYVKDGEKLIEWAKAQGRLVTKAELAEVIGKTKLSPSYFIKYPELGKYIKHREQQALREYSKTLYKWLDQNSILYKPNDKTTLKISVTALLLGEYSNIAIQLNIKPKCISKKQHANRMTKTVENATNAGVNVICIDENYFKNLDILKSELDIYKKNS